MAGVLERATAEVSCWPKMQPKRGSPAKRNAETQTLGATANAIKGKRVVGKGLVQKTTKGGGEQTRVWLHDALDASRPSDDTLNPFQP